MPDVKVIKQHQEAFLTKEKKRKQPQVYIIEGVAIVVNPGVFPPSTDKKLLASFIHVKPGDRILDLTSGSGTFSVIAGIQGASGIAVDINSKAVANSNENFKKYNVKMKAIESNMFEKVPHKQFDYIFANGPFFEGDITDPLDYACYGARTFLTDLFKGISKSLKKTGKLLIVLSEWSELNFFDQKIKENNLKSSLIATRLSDDGERKYRLYEVTL